MQIDQRTIDGLRQTVAPYDSVSLLTSCAALQLIPENATRWPRLQTLTRIAASVADVSSRPQMTPNRLRQLLNTSALSQLAGGEHEFESLFADAIEFESQRYLVLSGATVESTAVLQMLLRALESIVGEWASFLDAAHALVRAVLRISNQTLARSGIEAGPLQSFATSADVFVPAAIRMNALRGAVVFDVDDVDMRALAPILFEIGLPTPDGGYDVERDSLVYRPLIASHGRVLLALPGAVADALIRYVACLADEHHASEVLSAAFHGAARSTVEDSLYRLAILPTGDATEGQVEGIVWSRTCHRIDGDKVLELRVFTEDVSVYTRTEPWDTWRFDVGTGDEPSNDARRVLTLNVSQPFARPSSIEFGQYESDDRLTFALSAADLRDISFVEAHDPLALWKYVHEHWRVRGSAKVTAFGTLDEFAIYRQRNHSYYLTDGAWPNLVVVEAGLGRAVREDAFRSRSRAISWEAAAGFDASEIYDSGLVPLDVPLAYATDWFPLYRRVQEADEERVGDEIGRFVCESLGRSVGSVPDEDRTGVLNAIVSFLFERFASEVSTLAPQNLLRALVAQNETTYREMFIQRIGPDQDERTFERDLFEAMEASTSLRFLTEYVAAQPPSGHRRLTLEMFDRLLAHANQMIQIASLSDLLRYHMADIPLEILPSGRLGRREQAFRLRHEPYVRNYVSSRMTDRADDRVTTTSPDAFLSVGVAEFGVDLGDLTRFFRALVSLGNGTNAACTRMEESLLVARLMDDLGWGATNVASVLERFTLRPRERFLEATGFRKEDVYPWRFNRRLAYRRRPLVTEVDSIARHVTWGNRSVLVAWRYLWHQLVVGQYPTEDSTLLKLMGQITAAAGKSFNELVARTCEADQSLIVRREVKKIRNTDGPPGDLDVLIAHQRRKRIILLECKKLVPAGDAYSHHSEYLDLVEGSRSRRPIVAKQAAREQWGRANLEAVLQSLNVKDARGWSVESIIVVDEDLPVSFLRDVPMRVVSLAALRDELRL